MSLNRCEFIGNVGADPEIRAMQNGDKVANIRLAVSRRWKDKTSGERKEATTWVPVVVWGALVSVVESYVRKGSKIYIAGSLEVRKWTDNAGADRYSTEIVLGRGNSDLELLDRKDTGDAQERPQASGRGASGGGAVPAGRGTVAVDANASRSGLDDEIPF